MTRLRHLRYAMIGALTVVLVAFASAPANCLTVEEAIIMAEKTLPLYQGDQLRQSSSKALFDASLGAYLPTLDASASQVHDFESVDDFNSRAYDVTLSYLLYDFGRRKANRSIARYNWESTKESVKTTYLDLAFQVKVAFNTVIAREEVLKQRQIQVDDATKDYEVAQGRFTSGVVKRSDVLQASVRLEQGRFNLIQAEGEYRKAIAALNSLIGQKLDAEYKIEGALIQDVELPDWNRLSELVTQRPEVLRAQYGVEIAKNDRRLVNSEFFPDFSVDVSYDRVHFNEILGGVNEGATAGVFATWNVFELGKFFRRKSTSFNIKAAEADVDELKRVFLLDVRQTYEDVITADRNIIVAKRQLEDAEFNYSQAFGEYKVGKADILSLVQAESALAVSRVQFIVAKLDLAVSKALLERQAGVDSIEKAFTSPES